MSKSDKWSLFKEKDYDSDPDVPTLKGWVVMLTFVVVTIIFFFGLLDVTKRLSPSLYNEIFNSSAEDSYNSERDSECTVIGC